MAITTYTAGQVLTAASLNNNFASGGLQFIKSQTIGSAVASVEVTGAFSATYDNYKIVLSGGAASATGNIRLTFGATTTGYYQARNGLSYANVSGDSGSANQANFASAGGHAAGGLSMTADVCNPFLADETVVTTSNVQLATAGGAYFFNGYLNDTTSYTAFTLTAQTGTFTGGIIRVYGYAND